MMIFEETYALYNGVQVPRLGLGTWFIPDDAAAQAVQEAVRIGYRHFDTAQAYENEHGVGEGIRTCGASREELFVTTKLAAEAKTYAEAAAKDRRSKPYACQCKGRFCHCRKRYGRAEANGAYS